MEPCPLCVGALAMTHIVRVEFAARDLWAGSSELLGASRYMRSKNVEVAGPKPGPGEAMLAMNVEYWLRQPDTPPRQGVIEIWREALPSAVERSQELAESGRLLAAAQACVDAKTALGLLEV